MPGLAESDVEMTSPAGNLEFDPTGKEGDVANGKEDGTGSDGRVDSEVDGLGCLNEIADVSEIGDKSCGNEEEGESGSIEDEKLNGEEQQVTAREASRQKDAELENYLESLKPKPKRKSIKEMLMSMPGYKELASITPRIGGGKKEDVIILDDEVNKRKSAKELKRWKEIEALKDRFVRHCTAGQPNSTKGEHVTLKIHKKEEDSQGIEHIIENEVEYVRNPLNEEEEAVSFLSPKAISPMAPPGDKRRRLKDALMEKIRAQKLKEHEERVKEYKMYNDENDGGDGEKSEDEEEIVEDEDEEETESEEDEEEDLESLLRSSKNKEKKKSEFVDDEAEDDDDNDDDEDDSTDNSDSEDEKEPTATVEEGSQVVNEESSQSGVENAEKISQPSTPVKQSSSEENENCIDFGPDITPKITTAVLNQRTPSDFWIPSNSSATCRHMDELSPLIPRIDNSQSPRSENFKSFPAVPESLASVLSEPKAGFGDLVEMCSGRFVSQINPTDLTESQEENEYGGFDFGDDEDLTKNNGSPINANKTAEADTSRTAVDGLTPKLSEKVPKTRLLMQFDEEADKGREDSDKDKLYDPIKSQNDLEEDDEEEAIGIKIKGRKQKRLQFSDDEDEDGPEENQSNSNSGDDENADEVESEEEAVEASEEIAEEEKLRAINPFFNKRGQLKRKFVEEEAELSGSEEGSDDEDEKGLNHYEDEDGDVEDLDEEDVRNQVEKAYLKRMHDDDDMEIRHLQNKYLENGEFHSDRQRMEKKFTWNINSADLNDDAVFGNSDEEEVEETPQDAKDKREWIEKRKWLSENSHLLEAREEETQSLLNNSKLVKVSKSTIKKLESIADTSTSDSSNVVIKESSIQRRSIYEEFLSTKSAIVKKSTTITSFSEGLKLDVPSSTTSDAALPSKSVSQPMFGDSLWSSSATTGLKRGSFLSRGGTLLQKLAEVTKQGDQVSNVKSNSRNFVFQHITPPNVEKTDGSTSRVKRGPSAGSKQAASKKIKVDRSFSNLDESSKSASIFKYL